MYMLDRVILVAKIDRIQLGMRLNNTSFVIEETADESLGWANVGAVDSKNNSLANTSSSDRRH